MIPLITRQHRIPVFNLALLKTKYSFDLIDNFLASLNALDYQITSLEVFEDYLSDFSDEVLREAKKAVEKAIEKANITNKSPDEVAELISELEDIERTQEETSDDEKKRKEMYEREREYWEEEARKTAEDEAGRPLDDLTEEIIRETEETARETEAIEEEVVETGGAGGVINTGTGTSGTAGESGRTTSTGETAISRAREQVERDREATNTARDGVTHVSPVITDPGSIVSVGGVSDGGIGMVEVAAGETVVATTSAGETITIKNNTGDTFEVYPRGGTLEVTEYDRTFRSRITAIASPYGTRGRIPGTEITVTSTNVDGSKTTTTTKTDTNGNTTVTQETTKGDTTTISTYGNGNHIETESTITRGGDNIGTKTSWTDDNGVMHTNGVGKDSGGNTVGYSQSENDDGVVVTENQNGSGETTSVSFDGTPVEYPVNPGDIKTIDGIGTIINNGDGTGTWISESGTVRTGTPVVDDDGNIKDVVVSQ